MLELELETIKDLHERTLASIVFVSEHTQRVENHLEGDDPQQVEIIGAEDDSEDVEGNSASDEVLVDKPWWSDLLLKLINL